ncbi:hypothetical protein [Dyadobacter sp. SG02]|nr:hypothetical protein [Dyadobacter sp. SG02]
MDDVYGVQDMEEVVRIAEAFTQEVPTSIFQDQYQYFRLPDKQVRFA